MWSSRLSGEEALRKPLQVSLTGCGPQREKEDYLDAEVKVVTDESLGAGFCAFWEGFSARDWFGAADVNRVGDVGGTAVATCLSNGTGLG